MPVSWWRYRAFAWDGPKLVAWGESLIERSGPFALRACLRGGASIRGFPREDDEALSEAHTGNAATSAGRAVLMLAVGGKIDSITIDGKVYSVVEPSGQLPIGRVPVGPSAWTDVEPPGADGCIVPHALFGEDESWWTYSARVNAFLLADGLLRVAGHAPDWARALGVAW